MSSGKGPRDNRGSFRRSGSRVAGTISATSSSPCLSSLDTTLHVAELRANRAVREKAEAEKRLAEAELTLKAALEELRQGQSQRKRILQQQRSGLSSQSWSILYTWLSGSTQASSPGDAGNPQGSREGSGAGIPGSDNRDDPGEGVPSDLAISRVEQKKPGLQALRNVGGRHCLCLHSDSCVAHAIGNATASFLLGYGVRVGVGILLRAFRLIREGSFRSLLDLQLLLSEKNLIVREEAARLGLLFGGFSGLYHATRCALRQLRGEDTPLNAFLAGAVSGLSVLSIDDANKRRSFALYLLTRVGQSAYLSKYSPPLIQRMRSNPFLQSYGSTLLFSLSAAQIMYAYVMRPETLGEGYKAFLNRVGPIPAATLEQVRRNVRGLPVHTPSLTPLMRAAHGKVSPLPGGPLPSIVPCDVLHPHSASCLAHQAGTFRDAFKQLFVLYLSLTVVPAVLFNLKQFKRTPGAILWRATRSAAQATTFLSLFCSTYQAVICTQRNIALKDHKSIYWIAGGIAGLALLVEKPSRRPELTLYALPRAADALLYILVHRHILPDVPFAEVALFCTCMGGLMFFYETDPTSVPSFLRNILSRILSLSALPSPDSILPLSPSHPSDLHQLQPGKESEGVRRRGGRRGRDGEGRSRVGEEEVEDTEVTVRRLEESAFQGL